MITLRILLAAALLAAGVQHAAAGPVPTNVTNLSFDPGHGTQVEYVAANGTNFLWYPGNRVILPGHWKLIRASAGRGTQICFVYGPNTWNPVTGVVGAQWECEPTSAYTRFQVERAKGDIFGLAHRTAAPFPLSREKTSFGDLSQRMGLPTAPRR